jgi:hypothetical protein
VTSLSNPVMIRPQFYVLGSLCPSALLVHREKPPNGDLGIIAECSLWV